jgi:alpha-N-arabinofuranosidase
MHQQLRPTLPGFYSDPTICAADGWYYLTTSTFEYFPGCPLFRSRDLVRWEQIGHILDRPEQLPLAGAVISGGIYAPTLRLHDGRFYCVTTNQTAPRRRGGGNFIVHTTDPAGPWSDPIWIDGMEGIDPDLFWDEDGVCYAQWSLRPWPRRGPDDICIGQAAIDPITGRLLEEPRVLWRGTGGLGPEGPHLYRIGEYYYLCIAEGGTDYGHMQTIARSRTPRGPFEPGPRNPVLTHRSLPTAVHAVGHADIVQGPEGRWFGVCHGVRPKGSFSFQVLGRETFAFPVRWQPDGWPVFGDDGRLPAMAITAPVETLFRDDFDDTKWPPAWNYLRNPRADRYQRGDGQMVLRGAEDGIESQGQPTWVGIRQRDHCCSFKARLTVELDADGEAGLTAFQNREYHACIGLRRLAGVTSGFVRIRVGELVWEEPWTPPADFQGLAIRAEDRRYHLSLLAGGEMDEVRSLDARLLSREFGGRFTGVYLALYAQGASRLVCRCCSYEPAD